MQPIVPYCITGDSITLNFRDLPDPLDHPVATGTLEPLALTARRDLPDLTPAQGTSFFPFLLNASAKLYQDRPVHPVQEGQTDPQEIPVLQVRVHNFFNV